MRGGLNLPLGSGVNPGAPMPHKFQRASDRDFRPWPGWEKGSMLRLLLLLATLPLLALQPASAAAYLPPGFIGISPQGPTSAEDFALMEEAGIRSVRLPMYWASIQPENPSVEKPNFSGFDRSVEMAAEHGMRVFPFLWDSPLGSPRTRC